MKLDVACLMFLVNDYNLNFSSQTFNNCPYGNWITKTYSFYNNTGCFTINYLVGRDELDFYFSTKFSNNYCELHEKLLNVWIDEPEIWNKHQKWLYVFKDQFFWWNKRKIIRALADVIRKKIEVSNEFFGVKT